MTRAALLLVLLLLALAGPAEAAQESRSFRFTASDGVSLLTTLSGEAPLGARPTIVEFSPYGRGSQTLDPGPDYNLRSGSRLLLPVLPGSDLGEALR